MTKYSILVFLIFFIQLNYVMILNCISVSRLFNFDLHKIWVNVGSMFLSPFGINCSYHVLIHLYIPIDFLPINTL